MDRCNATSASDTRGSGSILFTPNVLPGVFASGGELRSAIARLPFAMIVADSRRKLRPLNDEAERLFDQEALTQDLVENYTIHPLARLIRAADAAVKQTGAEDLVFPSGKSYRVRISSPSVRDSSGWLLFVVEPVPADHFCHREVLFDEWQLTTREREVSRALIAGNDTNSICASLQITTNTFRTHVRHILEKSATHTRSAFVAAVLGGSAWAEPPTRGSGSPSMRREGLEAGARRCFDGGSRAAEIRA